jgi:hypothetical protein
MRISIINWSPLPLCAAERAAISAVALACSWTDAAIAAVSSLISLIVLAMTRMASTAFWVAAYV